VTRFAAITAIVLTAATASKVLAEDILPPGPLAQSPVSFIACPVYRDTNNGRKSGCWLATDMATGVRYDIGGGRTKPQSGRDVLVEGVLGEGANACGGEILLPVHVSVLQTTCSAVMLPAEGYPGRVFQVPKNGYLPPADVVRPLPPGPYTSRDWHIEFNFQSDFLAYQYSEVILDDAARYIRASRPRHVEVTGYADTSPYVISGRQLIEPRSLGEQRAKMVAEALLRLGVDPGLLHVNWHVDPAAINADDGMAEPSKRRVTIHIEI
jgi:outer membrane protein OmpA-like peptidoglycan-associated protein